MTVDPVVLSALKGLNALELLELIAYAKTGEVRGIDRLSEFTVKDAEEAVDWFLEGLKSEG